MGKAWAYSRIDWDRCDWRSSGPRLIVAAVFKAGAYVAKGIDYEIEQRKQRKRSELDQEGGGEKKSSTEKQY